MDRLRRLLPVPLAVVAVTAMSAPAAGHVIGASASEAAPLPGVVPFHRGALRPARDAGRRG